MRILTYKNDDNNNINSTRGCQMKKKGGGLMLSTLIKRPDLDVFTLLCALDSRCRQIPAINVVNRSQNVRLYVVMHLRRQGFSFTQQNYIEFEIVS